MPARPRIDHSGKIARIIISIPAAYQRKRKRQLQRHLWLANKLSINPPLPVNRNVLLRRDRIRKRLAILAIHHTERHHARHQRRALPIAKRQLVDSDLSRTAQQSKQILATRCDAKRKSASVADLLRSRTFRAFSRDGGRVNGLLKAVHI